MSIPMWITWLIVAAFCFIAEIITVGFFVFWLGIGALLSMLLSFVTDSIVLQIGVWVIASTLMIIFTKPLVNKYLKTKTIPTNVYTILGKKALVTEEINNALSKGQIKVDSDVWSAKSIDNTIIPEGTIVEISKIEGVKTVVKTITEDSLATESK